MKPGLALILLLAVPSQAYDTIRFLDPIKTAEMARPVAAAASATRLYVLDEKKSALYIYDAAGKLIKAVGKSGSDKSSFSSPQGIALGPDGRVFVADTGNSRVQILDADGNFLGSFGEKGSDPGALKSPESVSIGSFGRVFVADTGNHRVQIFTDQGILLSHFGGSGKLAGQMSSPKRVQVDYSDHVWVLDAGNDRLQRFDPSGKFVQEVKMEGDDFVADAFGYLYILDSGAGKVKEQNAEGVVLGQFGSVGTGPGQFKKAQGLALCPDGSVAVLDTGNGRIHRIEVENKAKVSLLPPSLETRLTVSGPSKSLALPAEALAGFGEDLYAWLPKEGKFAVVGEDGKEKSRFGAGKGKGKEVTKGVGGLAVSKKHGIFVSDLPSDRIQLFNSNGSWRTNLAESTGMFDGKKKEGRVRSPRGVAINEQGTIYVADAGNRRVDAFSPDGVFLFGIGPKVGKFELIEPVAVAWDKARFVYFLDKGLKRVFKCEPSGALVASWGEAGAKPGQFSSPEALAFDGQNYLYILDSGHKRVSVFDRDGRWMTDLFSGGKGERQLTAPVALAVAGMRLAVADKGRGRVAVFDLHPALGAPREVSSSTKEGIVALSWAPSGDPWAERYRVFRSTVVLGPYAEVGKTEAPKFQDSSAAAYQTYFYRVAVEAKTKDVGAAGGPVEVFVAGSFNRSPVEISTITLGNIFSANYKWYLKNPVGTAVLTNNVNVPFQNVKLTFRLKDFMDFGYDTDIKKLDPQARLEVPLIATLNNKILDVSEDTPVQAEFTLTYFEEGKQQSVSLTKPLRVYSRNAITWENPQRIANFITPKDPPILEYARETLRQTPKSAKADVLNGNVVTAMHLWDSLSEHGVKFFSNPSSPYETISEDPNFPVDYAQFPRETLKRKSGQCDDLVTLLISMLDGAKVRGAILDYPGHMALMIDTESDDLTEAGLPEDHLILHDGSYWVPLEATLIGKPFSEAVRKAAHAYRVEAEKGKVQVVDVRKAWQTFEPATMPSADFKAEVPKVEAREKRFDEQASALAADRNKFLKKHFEDRLKADPKDLDARLELGLVEFQSGAKEAAVEEFNKVLAADPKNAAALNNLGNVAFLSGDFAAAEGRYLKAAAADAQDADIWLNLVKTARALKDKAKAAQYGKKAVAAERSLAPAVETLLKGI